MKPHVTFAPTQSLKRTTELSVVCPPLFHQLTQTQPGFLTSLEDIVCAENVKEWVYT